MRVLHKRGPAIFARDWNQRTTRCSDSNGENPHARFRRRFRCDDRVAAQVFAVGENNERTITSRCFAIDARRERDRFGNISAAFGNGLGVEIADRIDCRAVVNR